MAVAMAEMRVKAVMRRMLMRVVDVKTLFSHRR